MPIRSKPARSTRRAWSRRPGGSAASGTRNQPKVTGRPGSGTAARPDPDRPELEGHVDQDELAGAVGGDGQRRLVGHFGRVAGRDRLAVEAGRPVDQVHIGAAAGAELVPDLVAGVQGGDVHAGVLVDADDLTALGPHDLQQPPAAVLEGEHLLLDLGRQVGGVGQDPDLDEPHRLVLGGVLLRVQRPRPQRHPLNGPGGQRAGRPADRVLVPEQPLDHIGQALDVPVGVHGPDRPRDQPVVVEHPHGPEAVVGRVAVVIKGEVPAGAEPAALLTVDLLVAPDGQHGRSWSASARRQPSDGMFTWSGKYLWNSLSRTPSVRSWSITSDRGRVFGEPLARTAPYCSSVLNWPATASPGYRRAASTTIGTSDMTAST